MRETTERPEVLSCGAALLTGTTVDGIVNAANRVLSDDALYQSMVAAKNPFARRARRRVYCRHSGEKMKKTAANKKTDNALSRTALRQKDA